LLAATRHGFVNVHFSLLPRWRGAAPVERAILAGDAETGVWIMEMEEGLDTGGAYAVARTPIGRDETAGELRQRLVALGTDLLVQHLPAIPDAAPSPQVGEAVYADKLRPEEFELDPARTAAELVRAVRAGNPRPGAFTVVDGKRLKVLRAHTEPGGDAARPGTLATADGLLVFDEVQPEGKRAMPARAWLAGRRSSA
jgi:methionyl-tRNA formyltransferase